MRGKSAQLQINLAALIALSATTIAASPAAAMSFNFTWEGVNACGSSPPAFTLSDVPRETKQLAFRMVDLDYPSYPHGGGTIAYQGDQIPAGSFSYKGPCPPRGQHTYQWTVKALDANGKMLATAVTSRPFPPR